MKSVDSGTAEQAVRDYRKGLTEERLLVQIRLDEIDAELRRVDGFLGKGPTETRGETRDEFAPADLAALVEIARRDERGLTKSEMYEAALVAKLSLAQGERGRKNVSRAIDALDKVRLYRSAGGKYKARKRPA